MHDMHLKYAALTEVLNGQSVEVKQKYSALKELLGIQY